MSSTNGDRFPLGKLCMTPGIQALLEETESEPFTFLARHASGDWGEVCEEDAEANEQALAVGTRIFSVYRLDGTKLWVITEADRSVTTLLLPEEY